MVFKATKRKLYIKEYLNITSKELASKVGISEVTASNILNNKTAPSLDTLCKIADVLNVPVSYLLGDNVVSAPAPPDMCAFVRCDGVHRTADNWAEFWALVDELDALHPRR